MTGFSDNTNSWREKFAALEAEALEFEATLSNRTVIERNKGDVAGATITFRSARNIPSSVRTIRVDKWDTIAVALGPDRRIGISVGPQPSLSHEPEGNVSVQTGSGSDIHVDNAAGQPAHNAQSAPAEATAPIARPRGGGNRGMSGGVAMFARALGGSAAAGPRPARVAVPGQEGPAATTCKLATATRPAGSKPALLVTESDSWAPDAALAPVTPPSPEKPSRRKQERRPSRGEGPNENGANKTTAAPKPHPVAGAEVGTLPRSEAASGLPGGAAAAAAAAVRAALGKPARQASRPPTTTVSSREAPSSPALQTRRAEVAAGAGGRGRGRQSDMGAAPAENADMQEPAVVGAEDPVTAGAPDLHVSKPRQQQAGSHSQRAPSPSPPPPAPVPSQPHGEQDVPLPSPLPVVSGAQALLPGPPLVVLAPADPAGVAAQLDPEPVGPGASPTRAPLPGTAAAAGHRSGRTPSPRPLATRAANPDEAAQPKRYDAVSAVSVMIGRPVTYNPMATRSGVCISGGKHVRRGSGGGTGPEARTADRDEGDSGSECGSAGLRAMLGECTHVLEIYGLTTDVLTCHLEEFVEAMAPQDGRPLPVIKWVDDNHALLVCPDRKTALLILQEDQDLYRLRPFTEASAASKAVAPSELLPPRERPKTTAAVAKKMLSFALGMNQLRDRSAEKELAQNRKAAREARREREAKLAAAWDDD